MAVNAETLRNRYHLFQTGNESPKAKAADWLAEKLVRMRVDAFKGELSLAARALLSLWNLQRKSKGLPIIELKDMGPTAATSVKGIHPERRQITTKLLESIERKQLEKLGKLFATKHPVLRRTFRLPPADWQQRRIIEKEFGFTPPKILIVDVTQRCDLPPEQACPHCFKDSGPKGRDIEAEKLHQLVKQCQFMGTGAIMFSGGEPFHLAEMLIKEATKSPDMLFYAFTNGRVLAERPEIVEHMPGNFVPILNITPAAYFDEASSTQASQERLIKAGENLKGRIFIASLAVEELMVRDESFPNQLNELLGDVKPFGLLLLPYMPVGRAADSNLVISSDRSTALQQLGDKLTNTPIVLTEYMLRETGAGCPAGVELGHALPLEGRISPCPFSNSGVPFNVDDELGLVISWSKIGELTRAFRNPDGCAVYDITQKTGNR